MKKLLTAVTLAALMTVTVATAALAAPGGAPAAHGVDGRTFGAATSELAQSYPGAVADHIQMFK